MHVLAKSLLCALLVVVTGCETTVRKQYVGPDAAVTVNVPPQSKAPPAASDDNGLSLDDALGTDPSVQRLEKIIAAMLLYYEQTNQLPEHLGDLLQLDAGLPLENTSHKPYVYHRDGLKAPGVTYEILVNDPTATSDGRRWCIIRVPPGKGTAAQLETRPIPESAFLTYR